MAPPAQQVAHDDKMEVSIAILNQQMISLSESLVRIEALVKTEIAARKTPWPQLLGAVMLMLSPAAGIFWHFEEAVTQLRLINRDSMNERRELRAALTNMQAQRCPMPSLAPRTE